MKKSSSFFVLISFLVNCILPSPGYAQAVFTSMPNGSGVFRPAVIKGLKIFADNPFKFDFIVDTADSGLKGNALKEESRRLVKYFMASLTTPENDMWVNLSPLEPDRIIPKSFGETEMGRDLLAEDYVLKQAASSLTNPDNEVGRKFWDKLYAAAYEKYGTTDIPVDAMSRVWIVPEEAVVYENGDEAFVGVAVLKVMLESDYAAAKAAEPRGAEEVLPQAGSEASAPVERGGAQELSKQILREVVVPVLEKEVNEGKTFARVRQVYNSMILATWFKRNLRESALGKVYVDKNKTTGVDIKDKEEKFKIYRQYLDALKKGTHNIIREEVDPVSQELVPRKYFSGGILPLMDRKLKVVSARDDAMSAGKFVRSLGLFLTLIVVSVMFAGCGKNQQTGTASQTGPAPQSMALTVPGTISDETISEEYGWSNNIETVVREFHKEIGPGFQNKPIREQVVALANFIKSREGLGIEYSTDLTRSNELRQQGGDLESVLRTRRAICTGFARMLFFLLGHQVGILEVQNAGGAWDHVMNIVSLPDGNVILVDLSTNVRDGFIMTDPFGLDEYYTRGSDGVYRLISGKKLPFNNQNFIIKDGDSKYEVFKPGLYVSYNGEELFRRFEGRKKVFLAYSIAGERWWKQKKYGEAIGQFEKAIAAAEKLQGELRAGGVLSRIVKNPDQTINELEDSQETLQANIDAARQNQGLSSENSSSGDVQEEDAEWFNGKIDQVNDLVKNGLEAANHQRYPEAKQFFEDALSEVGTLEDSQVFKDQSEGLKANIRKARKETQINLQRVKEAISDKAQVGGIDMNAKNLKIETTGKAIEFDRFYNVDDLKNAPGLLPVIMNIQPVSDPLLLLGGGQPK